MYLCIYTNYIYTNTQHRGGGSYFSCTCRATSLDHSCTFCHCVQMRRRQRRGAAQQTKKTDTQSRLVGLTCRCEHMCQQLERRIEKGVGVSQLGGCERGEFIGNLSWTIAKPSSTSVGIGRAEAEREYDDKDRHSGCTMMLHISGRYPHRQPKLSAPRSLDNDVKSSPNTGTLDCKSNTNQ